MCLNRDLNNPIKTSKKSQLTKNLVAFAAFVVQNFIKFIFYWQRSVYPNKNIYIYQKVELISANYSL